MRKQASLPVRLETDQKEGIVRIGADLGLSPSAIIRLLVKSLIKHYVRNNIDRCEPTGNGFAGKEWMPGGFYVG